MVAAFTFKHVPFVVVMIVKPKGRFVRSGVVVYRFESCAIMAHTEFSRKSVLYLWLHENYDPPPSFIYANSFLFVCAWLVLSICSL